MPTTTGVTTIGTISTMRMARTNGSSRTHSSASPRPSAVSIATAQVTNLSVVQTRAREDRIVERLAVLAEADVRDRSPEAVELHARPARR